MGGSHFELPAPCILTPTKQAFTSNGPSAFAVDYPAKS